MLWRNRHRSSVRGVVSVVGDTAYYGDYGGEFRAVETTTGQTVWSQRLAGKHQGQAVVDGVAYVSSIKRLFAFDADSGRPLWTRNPPSGRFGGPMVADSILYVGTSSPPTLHALDASTSDTMWSVSGGSITVSDGVVYKSIADTLQALDARTGAMLWQTHIDQGQFTGPTVSEGVVYLHSTVGRLYAFDATDRTATRLLWVGNTSVPTKEDRPQTPAAADGKVFVGANSTFYAFDSAAGKKAVRTPVWTATVDAPFFSSSAPSVANGVVYSTAGNHDIYAFDAKTGTVLWNHHSGGRAYPMRSSPRIVDGRLYHLATFEFTLYAFHVPKAETDRNAAEQPSVTEESSVTSTHKILEPSPPEVKCPDKTREGELVVFQIRATDPQSEKLQYELRVSKQGGREWSFTVGESIPSGETCTYRNNFTVWGPGTFEVQAKAFDGTTWSRWSDPRTIVCDSEHSEPEGESQAADLTEPNDESLEERLAKTVQDGTKTTEAKNESPAAEQQTATEEASATDKPTATEVPSVKEDPDSPFALEFNGASDHVVVPSLRPDWTSPFTLEAWVKPNILSPYNEFLCDAQSAGLALGFYDGICSFLLHDGKQYRRVLATEPTKLHEEIHVAGVFDGEMLTLFVNGQQQEPATAFPRHPKLSPFPLYLGANPQPNGQVIRTFSGTLDEVRLSDTARYQDEFEPSRRFESDAQTTALFHFDKGSGTVAYDYSGNNHHGQIRGAKWNDLNLKTSEPPAWFVALKQTGAEMQTGSDGKVISIAFRGNRFTDSELVHLQGLTDLKFLNLNDTRVTDTGLAHLKGLTSLQALYVGSRITDVGLTHLQGLTSLKSVGLNSNQITDAGLDHLQGLTSLESLFLQGPHVTDDGLERLKGLTSLKSLSLRGTQVTDDGKKELEAALPDCRIMGVMSTGQRLNNASWKTVGKAHLTRTEYDKALRQIQEAVALEPSNGAYLNTLGVAQYRVGDYDAALVTLTQSEELKSRQSGGSSPTDLVFLAMVNQQLGKTDLAREQLQQVRLLSRQPRWSRNRELRSFLQEAEGSEQVQTLEQRAEQGNAIAQATLANAYRTGEGVPQDDTEAFKWYRKAAEQGVATAQRVVGHAYRTGSGVKQDSVEAYAWFAVATSANQADGAQTMDQVKGEVEPHLLGKAEALATEYINKYGSRKNEARAAIEAFGGKFTDRNVLFLYDTQITDAGLEHLKGLTSLVFLSLRKTQITDAGLEHLKELTRLRTLFLANTQITDAGLEHIKGLTSLEVLTLDNTQISDAGLEHLKGLTSLITLNLDNTQITGAGLEHIKGLASLESLAFQNSQVTDAGLKHLKGLTKLESLTFRDTQITDAGLEHLKGLAGLEFISLHNAPVTHAGLEHLKELTRLRTLILDKTQITDAGLEHLKGLTRLKALTLHSTLVTDAGLEHLKGLTNLSTLDLGNNQITDAGVEDLKKALPQCNILK